MSVLCCLPSDSRSPALLCVRRWSVWNKRWSRRGRSNACWRSNYETPSGRARTQRTATGFWRRRWRISSPRWEIWPWVQGLVTFDLARPHQGLYFGVRCLTRARVLRSASGRSFIWKVKKKNKIGELDITCVHSGQTQTERWSWRMQISNWKWPSPSPRSTSWFWLSYACLKWTVKMRRRRSLMSPVFVLWRQCFNSAGACMYLTGGTLCTFSDILYTGEHWLLQPLLYKDTTRMDCLLKLQDPIETLMLISIFIWY